MNYLAHLHLAHGSEHSLQGALLGDEIKGRDWQQFAPPLQQAILQHRAIDAFTDKHPFILGLAAAFPQGQRRFAGIVLDLACDYWLTHSWEQLESTAYPRVLNALEQQLEDEWHQFKLAEYPQLDRYRQRQRAMLAEHWLGGYGVPENLYGALRGIQRRLRRPVVLTPLLEQLPERPEGFIEFYRELQQFARQWPQG